MRTPSGLRIDNPAWPLLQALISYWGTTDNDGNVAGTTIRCGGLATEPPYENHALKILTGPSAGQTRDLTLHPAGTDTLTVAAAFTNVTGAAQQILAGTKFVVLSKTPAIAEVAALTALVVALIADIEGATGIFHEQADVAFNVNAVLAAEADIFHLAAADTRYIVRSLRLKCVDPGAETVTVRLYELVNDALTEVDSFLITNANFATYHSMMDMFGLNHLAGDELQVTVQASAVGPYAVTGQYSVGNNNV
ncbi:MAG: hypothetical protein E3J60_00530 [Dehalococcoidia bacterium]|nr:MAG: hypothetical protein E3J60_00530 [Dehalococcoidia bacterium]